MKSMGEFVRGRDNSASPGPSQSRRNNQPATNLRPSVRNAHQHKVSVPPTSLRPEKQQQPRSLPSHQQASAAHQPRLQPADAQTALARSTHFPTDHRKGDTFDASEIDSVDGSTMTLMAVPQHAIQVEDSQLDSQGQPVGYGAQQGGFGDEEESSGEDDESEEDFGEYYEPQIGSNDEDIPDVNNMHAHATHMRDELMVQNQPGSFDANYSYPSTTSGLPESEDIARMEHSQNEPIEEEQSHPASSRPSRNDMHHERPPVNQQRPSQPSRSKSKEQTLPQPQQTLAMRSNQPQTTPRSGPQPYPARTKPLETSLPTKRSASALQENLSPSTGHPPAGNSLGSQTAPAMNIQIEQPTPRRSDRVGPVLDDETHDLSPLDYSLDDLRKKPYSDLHGEQMDYDPNPPTYAIPIDVANAALSERMNYVCKHFDPKNQHDFLSALPATHWEEAGEWFAERFGEMMKQIVAARREKRSIAARFEEEVHQRDEAVAQKKRRLNMEMTSMKQSGSKLLQRTPQKSKT